MPKTRRGSQNHLAFELALREPWQILEDDLRLLLAIANREAERLQPGDPGWEPGRHEPRSLALSGGRPLDETEGGWVRDGVAVIPIMGPIFRRANLFTEISGATSLELVARDVAAAVRDPSVRAVVLEIDSPGGQAAGIAELASHIFSWRDGKPMVAYVGNQAASAAYYLASAAAAVVLAPPAWVGSIGTVLAVDAPDQGGRRRTIEFVSAQSPHKRPDPTTERGREQYQAVVDQTTEVFVADVARYRGVDPETVVAEFGGGGLRMGQDAIDRGMADRLGSLEGLLSDLAKAGRMPAPARPLRIAATAPPTSPSSGPPPAPPGPQPESEVPMASWKQIKDAVMGIPDDFDPATATGMPTPTPPIPPPPPPPNPTPTPTPPPTAGPPAVSPEIEELRRQVASLRDQNAAILGQMTRTDAAALERQVAGTVRALVLGRTAFSSEEEPLLSVYMQAARDDRERPLVGADGTPAASRLELLAAWQAARPRHNLFEPAVAGELPEGARVLMARAAPADPRDPNAPTDPKRIEQLAGLTALGTAALELKAKRAGGNGNGHA